MLHIRHRRPDYGSDARWVGRSHPPCSCSLRKSAIAEHRGLPMLPRPAAVPFPGRRSSSRRPSTTPPPSARPTPRPGSRALPPLNHVETHACRSAYGVAASDDAAASAVNARRRAARHVRMYVSLGSSAARSPRNGRPSTSVPNSAKGSCRWAVSSGGLGTTFCSRRSRRPACRPRVPRSHRARAGVPLARPASLPGASERDPPQCVPDLGGALQ
jgi:hypothetical protein